MQRAHHVRTGAQRAEGMTGERGGHLRWFGLGVVKYHKVAAKLLSLFQLG